MTIVRLIRYVISYEEGKLETAINSLRAAGVKDLKHYPTIKVIDGYFFRRKRKDLEKLDGVEAASTNIPISQEPEKDDKK